MSEEEFDEQQLADAARRLWLGRRRLSMTLYALQHGRRTPEQVRAVIERSVRAIYLNQLVRSRGLRLLAVH